jgi:hypothetical protein
MTVSARWHLLLVVASLVTTSGTAHAQAQPPTVTYGPPPTSSPPPTYYSPPALPQPPPPTAPPPNGYPITPRDYGAGPDTLGFREGMFIPPGYHLSTRPHRILLVSGLSMVSSPYLLGLIVGAFDGFDNQKGWLFLPIAGPFITSSRRHRCSDSSLVTCVHDSGTSTVLAIDGIVQGAGALTMLIAVAVQEKVLVRNDMGFIVAPSAVAGGAGITALGRF